MACVLAGLPQALTRAQTAPAGTTSVADKILFPSVYFRATSVAEALEFLRVKARDLAPKGQAPNIVAGEGVIDPNTRVTLYAEKITLTEALEIVARMARADVKVLDDEVFLTKSTTQKPPFPNSGTIAEVLRRQGQAQFPGVPFHKATLAEAVDFARIKGKDLEPQHQHVNVAIDPALFSVNATISLNGLPCTLYELLSWIAAQVDGSVALTGTTFYLQPAAQLPPKVEVTALPDLGAAGKVKFPTVTFQGTTIREAMEFLMVKSRDLDPQHKGVRVIIDSASADAAGAITLDSRDITGEKALRQIAVVAGLEMYQLKEAVLLRHPTKAVSAGFR